MKIFRPGLTILFLAFSVSFLFAQPQIIINELSQGPHDDWEWLEYLVLKDSTDIQGIYLSDNDTIHGGLGTLKLVQLKKDLPAFKSVKKGALIVIYKSTDSTWLNGQDPKLFDAGAPDTDFSDNVIIIPHTDTTYLEKGSWWPGFRSAGENLGIFDTSGAGIFGISYEDNQPEGDFTSNGWGMVHLPGLPYSFVGFYYGSNTTDAADSSYWLLGTSSLGTPGELNLNQDGVPVELTSFSINNLDNSFQLKWETATEINNYGFDIERSSNISDWNKIGFVPGHGTSTEIVNYQFVDSKIENCKTYYYRLKQIDYNGNSRYSKVVEINSGAVTKFELVQNYPNPFNPATTIKFTVNEQTPVSLIVYNTVGEKVNSLFDGVAKPGVYTFNFNGTDLASGIYIYQLKTDKSVLTKKMMLLK